jgi:hypothetical protein
MKIKKTIARHRTWVVYLYIREILNYFFIHRIIRKEIKKEIWNSLKLRYDWVGRIYTVVNIKKEDIGEDQTIKNIKVYDLIKPINSYLKSLDLHEIVYPAIEQLSERSYLVVYSPLFKNFTIFRTIKYLLVLGIILFASLKIIL